MTGSNPPAATPSYLCFPQSNPFHSSPAPNPTQPTPAHSNQPRQSRQPPLFCSSGSSLPCSNPTPAHSKPLLPPSIHRQTKAKRLVQRMVKCTHKLKPKHRYWTGKSPCVKRAFSGACWARRVASCFSGTAWKRLPAREDHLPECSKAHKCSPPI